MTPLAVSFITDLLHEKFDVPLLLAQTLDILFWGGAVLMNFVAVYAGLCTLAERKIAAHMQARVGPYQVGPHGSLQWLADALKLLFKEDIIPNPVDRFLFKFAPYLIMAGAFAAWVTLPYTENWSPGNLNVGVIFIIAIGSVSVIAILMAGWASANKWALFGAMRAAAQIVSYEVPMGITVLAALLMAGSLNLHEISAAQRTGFAFNFMSGPADADLARRLAPIAADLEKETAAPGFLSEDVVSRHIRRLASEDAAVADEAEAALRAAGPAALPLMKPHLEGRPLGALSWFAFRHAPFTLIAFVIMFICGLAETNRTPFDIPEAESELVAGYHVEYSGMRFSFFFLAEYAQMFVVSALAVTLFLGGWLPPFSTLESVVLATVLAGVGAAIGYRVEGTTVGLLLGALAGGGAGQAAGLLTDFLGGGTFTWMAELVHEPTLRYFEGAFWFFGKCFALVFVMMWLRWTLPRYRVDQLMDLCWKRLVPLAFINLLAIGAIEWLSHYWT